MVRPSPGFSSIEVLIAIIVVAVVSVAATGIAQLTSRIATKADENAVALNLARGAIGTYRQLSYEHVGLVGGDPVGLISPERTVQQSGRTYTITTSVQLLVDPEHSGGANGDYKQVEVTVTSGGKVDAKLQTLVLPLGFKIPEITIPPDYTVSPPPLVTPTVTVSPCSSTSPTPTVDISSGFVALDDTYCLPDLDSTVDVAVLANDIYPPGANITVTVTGGPGWGWMPYDALDGVGTYTPNDNFNGEDEFTYTITNNDTGETSGGTVHIWGPFKPLPTPTPSPTDPGATPTPVGATPTTIIPGSPTPTGTGSPTPTDYMSPFVLPFPTVTPSGSGSPGPTNTGTGSPNPTVTGSGSPNPSGSGTPDPSGSSTPSSTPNPTPSNSYGPTPSDGPPSTALPPPALPGSSPGSCVPNTKCDNGMFCTQEGYCPNPGFICAFAPITGDYSETNICSVVINNDIEITKCVYAATNDGSIFSYNSGYNPDNGGGPSGWRAEGQPAVAGARSLVNFDAGSGRTLFAGGVGGVASYAGGNWTTVFSTPQTVLTMNVGSNNMLNIATDDGHVLTSTDGTNFQDLGLVAANSVVTALGDFGGYLYAGVKVTLPNADDPQNPTYAVSIFRYSGNQKWENLTGIIQSATADADSGIHSFTSFFDGSLYAGASLPTGSVISFGRNAVQAINLPNATHVNALLTSINGKLYVGAGNGTDGLIFSSSDGQTFTLETTLTGEQYVDTLSVYQGQIVAGTRNGKVFTVDPTSLAVAPLGTSQPLAGIKTAQACAQGYCWAPFGGGQSGGGGYNGPPGSGGIASVTDGPCAQPLSTSQPYSASLTYSWASNAAIDLNAKLASGAGAAGACNQPPGDSLSFSGDSSGLQGSETVSVNLSDPVYSGGGVVVDAIASWNLLYPGTNDESLVDANTGNFSVAVSGLRDALGTALADQTYFCNVPRSNTAPLCSGSTTAIGQLIYSVDNGSVTFSPGSDCSTGTPL